jgi:hypothetical protein
MIARVAVQLAAFALTAMAAWVLPAWGVSRLLPALESAGRGVVNYRGRPITHGLGIVWLLWAGGVMMAAGIGRGAFEIMSASVAPDGVLQWHLLQAFWPMRAGGMLPLVLAAFGFGLIDDLFGDRSVRGFRGHLGGLVRGRVTTGALKVFGIGAAAAYVATDIASTVIERNSDLVAGGWTVAATWWAAWALVALVIALTANLVNLMDVRPGRALKAYSLLAVCGAAGILATVLRAVVASDGSAWASRPGAPELVGSALGLLVLVLGPVFAAWRHDLGERAMLGDAGANAAGALAGYLVASSLSLTGLAVAAALLLALNLASEKVSYTEVIQSNALLRWLDGLGRRRDGAGEHGGGPVGPESAVRPAGE